MTLDQFVAQVHALQRRLDVLKGADAPGAAGRSETVLELQQAVEELLVAEEELHQQHEELVASHRALDAERRRYLDLFEFAPDGYLVTDLYGMIREANRAAAVLVNVEQPFLVGKPLANFINDTRRATFRAFLGRVLDTRQRVELEIQIQPRGRAPFEALLSVAGMRDTEGRPTGLRWLLRDITEQKRAEEQIRALNAELEARVAERTAELRRSNEELQQFPFVVSHDLQEPLRMVTNYVQLLAKRYAGRLDADADEFIGYAVEGTTRMQQLIRDLLEYSRVQTRPKAARETDCEELVRRALTTLRVAIEETGAVVTYDSLPVVMADASQLEQVWQNLLSNALKFRGPDPPRVHISAARQEREWVFAVRDNGIGIEPQFAERIFVVFQRLHSRQQYPGTGMGLAICKRIIERHGGRIWVESAPGKGATFYFTLPERENDSSG
jgi:PAS domain S-box-containing protein